MDGSGSFSIHSENGISTMSNRIMTWVRAAPMLSASVVTSALKSVFATTASVSRAISRDISSSAPSAHSSRVCAVHSTIDDAYPIRRSR